jgi:aerobic carbon-monoxide dehydrogenase small subunit
VQPATPAAPEPPGPTENVTVALTVNGRRVQVTVRARLTLADLLRDRLRLTGTHLGCEHGVCGACTVLLDGNSVRSCLTLAVQADGHEVTTVEGLAGCPVASRLKEAMSRRHGLQCGFCTPGFLIAARELLDDRATSKPLTDELVRETLAGNLCRCTGYQGIVRAVLETDREIEDLRGRGDEGSGGPTAGHARHDG